MRKARCALRGDLMAPGTNYYLSHINFPTVENSTARLLFAIAAEHGWPIEHFYNPKAYVCEPAMYGKEIYVRELARSDGNYAHGKSIRWLVKNLWGRKSAVHYYIEVLFNYLTEN